MAAFMTIERFILEQERKFPEATGTLTHLLYDMALASKIIARETTRAGLVNTIIGEVEGSVNATGDQQQKLDIFAEDVIFRMNDHTGRLCVMASEEHADIIPIPERFTCGSYVLIFDPLDGSGNIGVNVGVGTIFAIFRKVSDGPRGTLQDVLQPGRQLVAAGYTVYGPSTMMVYSTGQGVHGFTLDPSVGEFLLSHPNITYPAKPKYYSVNHGNERSWTPGVQQYIRWLQGFSGDDSPNLSLRYIGSLVTDFHRNLLKGGVYLYPGNLHDPQEPDGKLRLMYENIPLAFLAEQAGGYASDGHGNILDIQPHTLHQKTPLFIGNRALVEQAEAFIRRYDGDWLAAYLPRRQSRSSQSVPPAQ
ncbi:MAG: class 1 fructose-bisphosphatase [Anaerolineae bacterium]|nr:class 1 fructose-bisphosphatase [Anaerolineae bacterium]